MKRVSEIKANDEGAEANVYYIVIHSTGRFVFSFIVFVLISIYLNSDILFWNINSIGSYITFPIMFFLSLYIAHNLSQGRAKVTVDINGIHHDWIKRFMFNKSKNLLIPWSYVENYVFETQHYYDSFIINLNNKMRYVLTKNTLLTKHDDFYRLIDEFPVKAYNLRYLDEIEYKKPIEKGKTIYQEKGFKWQVYFFIGLFLILLFSKIINPEINTRWSALVSIGFGLGIMLLDTLKQKD